MAKRFIITFGDGSEQTMESANIYQLLLSLDGQQEDFIIKIEQIAEQKVYLVKGSCYDAAQNYITLQVDVNAYSKTEACAAGRDILNKIIAHRSEIITCNAEEVI